ncbi:MAG: outer membrane protein assembly factor [Candidatus Sericytochromatia bacterium]
MNPIPTRRFLSRPGLAATVMVAAFAAGAPAFAQSAPEGDYGPPMTAPASPPPSQAKPAPVVDTEPKSVVKDIAVRGNQRVSDERILLSIPISIGDRVGRSDVTDAIQRIYGMGYFRDVQAGSEPVAGGDRLFFEVVENPVMGDVTFEGVTKVEEAKLEALFQSMKGAVINFNEVKAAIENIQKTYQEAGYPLARVAGMDLQPGGILALKVAEGRIHEVRVSGNEETKDYVVLRELATEPGEVFSSEKIQGDLRRVYNLNFFEEINLKFEPAPPESGNDVVVVIEVKEKQTGSINLGAGYSTREGILGMFSVKKENLFGTGQMVGMDLSVSQQFRVAGELTYFNPWFDESRTGLGGSLYARRFNNFLGDFREERYGLSANATRPLFGDALTTPWRGQFGARAEMIDTYQNLFIGGERRNVDSQGRPITLNPNGPDWIAGLTGGLTFDTRDILIAPTEGWFNTLTLEPSLVNPGTANAGTLLRSVGSVSHYIPLPGVPWAPTERSAIAINMRMGLISSFGSAVPAYERFYSTGPFVVRGWPEWVTPQMAIAQQYPQNYFQGSNAAVGTLEYRFPLVNVVSGAIFADTGMFWDDNFLDQNNNLLLHSGYGLGVRMNTPMGPIRLDYGLRSLDLSQGQIHFGIGQKF